MASDAELQKLNTRIDDLEGKLDTLEKTTNSILDEIRILAQRFEGVEKSATNIDEHIGFVNDVYDSVKTPFHKAMGMISWRASEERRTILPSAPQ